MNPRTLAAEMRIALLETALIRSQTLATAGAFAVEIMHEINNPLEAISNLAYLLEADAENAEKVRYYGGLLGEQLSLVRGIAKQTLGFYRHAEEPSPVDVVMVTEAALRIHRNKIGQKRIHVVKDLPPKLEVSARSGELLQVMSNLIGNSLDALPAGGRVRVRVKAGRDRVVLTVADNGHGIAKNDMNKVFEPFFTTKGADGTGLGLPIIKTILEQYNGQIRPRSSVRPGKSGTVFVISLPIGKQELAFAS